MDVEYFEHIAQLGASRNIADYGYGWNCNTDTNKDR